MVEKIIKLDDISLVDFLGVGNENIREMAKSFPKTKVISRGDEIRIQGSDPEIIKAYNTIKFLIEHYHTFGKVTPETINDFLHAEQRPIKAPEKKEGILIYGAKGIPIRPKTENQKQLVESIEQNDLVFAIGPAGTGKTYIAVACAVRALKNKKIKKIIITRPAVEAGENLGFLPGDLKDKVDPYLRPIYDALDDMIPSEKLKYYLENNTIEIAPLAYMRGRTLNQAYILLDEAQNTTNNQMKMFLTRMGPESKMIVTGDRSQIDLPRNQVSGLVEAVDILRPVHGIGVIELSGKDVVRHKLVRSIIDAYGKAVEKKEKQEKPKPKGDPKPNK